MDAAPIAMLHASPPPSPELDQLFRIGLRVLRVSIASVALAREYRILAALGHVDLSQSPPPLCTRQEIADILFFFCEPHLEQYCDFYCLGARPEHLAARKRHRIGIDPRTLASSLAAPHNRMALCRNRRERFRYYQTNPNKETP